MSEEKEKRKRGGAHPKHPKCPACGHALYKAMYGRTVKKDDPWAFCRYEECELYGKDQDGNAEKDYHLSGLKAWRKKKPLKKAPAKEKPAKKKKPAAEKKPAKKKPAKKKPVTKAPAEKAPSEKKPTKKQEEAAAAKSKQIAAIAKDLMGGKLSIKKIATKHHVGPKKVRAIRNKLQDRGEL